MQAVARAEGSAFSVVRERMGRVCEDMAFGGVWVVLGDKRWFQSRKGRGVKLLSDPESRDKRREYAWL